MTKDKRYRSDIPENALEETVRAYKQEGGAIWFRSAHCKVGDAVVGKRQYDECDRLIIETPLRAGKIHGTVYYFYESGRVQLAEPYADGLMHGVAKQFDESGKLMGSYTMKRGTGYDLWRHVSFETDTFYLCEIHSMHDGLPHGFEWWLNEDGTVYEELHWQAGEWHGIERQWNHEGRLRRGYPKYWVRNQPVNKRQYLSAAKKDQTLPKWQAADNLPQRRFPIEIEKLLNRSTKS